MNGPAPSFRVLLRVRYAECDQQGVVFNARYGDYVDLFMSELVRAAFGSYRAMIDAQLDWQVVRYLIEWNAPARFDDVLSLAATGLELKNTSFTTAIGISRHPGGEALATAEVVNVVVNTRDGAKTRIPDWCRAKLRAAAAGRTVDFSGGLACSAPIASRS